MIVIYLSMQQALDTDRRAVQQINFTGNLDRAGNTRIYFILKEAKETVLDLERNCKTSGNAIPLSGLIFASIKWHKTTV